MLKKTNDQIGKKLPPWRTLYTKQFNGGIQQLNNLTNMT